MKLTPVDPPRRFRAGARGDVEMSDCARIELAPDEQVTFATPDGAEYDVARKTWGFYATPSLNGRLARFGFRSALVRGHDGKAFVMLIERGREAEFMAYAVDQGLRVAVWLDDERALDAIDRLLDT